jgi:hypothetical protein
LGHAALEHDTRSVQIGTPLLVTKPTEDRGASEINLVENWVDELKRLVPR